MRRQAPQGADGRPTVGDTVSVVQRVAAPAGALVQPRAPTDTTVLTLLAPPDVTREGDSVRIAYTFAVWAAGRQDVALPGAIIVTPAGDVDTLATTTIRLDVASLLPADARPETVAPRAARPWVPRADRTLLPLLVLVPLVLALLAGAAWWWRRRGPAVPPRPPQSPPHGDPARLAAWIAAGEAALVVDHLAAALPDSPRAAEWRAAVAAVRFAPAPQGELGTLATEGLALLQGGGDPA